MLDANFIATTVPRKNFCSAARCYSYTNVWNLLFSHAVLSLREAHLLVGNVIPFPPLPSAPCIPFLPPPVSSSSLNIWWGSRASLSYSKAGFKIKSSHWKKFLSCQVKKPDVLVNFELGNWLGWIIKTCHGACRGIISLQQIFLF